MKRKYAVLILLFVAVLNVKAQHSTLRFTDSPINLSHQSLLLVPFESKMYLSDINQKLAVENQLTTKQIIRKFTTGIDQAILYTFQEKCNVSSFYTLEDEESEQDLNYVYDNLKLEYELVSSTVEKSKTEKFKSKFKKEKDNTYDRGSIKNGQIITKRDDRERYMKAVVSDNKMLDSMHFKFDNKYVLFVTQLDIMNVIEDPSNMQHGGFDREIKLHYTLYHINGEILSTGISRTTFPSTLNDINQIIRGYFPIIAQNIYIDLFPPDEDQKANKLNLNPWK